MDGACFNVFAHQDAEQKTPREYLEVSATHQVQPDIIYS